MIEPPDNALQVARQKRPRLFHTILADPPWDSPTQRIHHYPVMTLDRIAALPVGQLAAPDAHLWLWVTNGNWRQQATIMEAWGFSYRSCLTWIKPRFGMGAYLRNQTEHLLFGVRGRAPIQFRGQGTWLYAPVQEHSHKPEEQYAIIERCSPGPYLELFARRPRLGWSSWGNEVESDVIL